MMKRTRRFILISLIALMIMIFSSCSSVGALFKSNISGLPYWYYSPNMGIGRSKTALVGEGKASTQRQATLLASSDLIRQLSERLGYELGQEVYRELSVLGTIGELGLKVQNEYSAFQDGEYVVYLHAVLNASLLEKATSAETKRRAETAKTIEDLVLEGDSYMKSGQDLRAVRSYMQAMGLSYGLDYISGEYSFNSLYDVVYSLLDDMRLTLVSSKPESAVCTISLTRKGSYMASAVDSAEILASFKAVDIRGEEYGDSFVFVTDSDGLFEFNTINNSLVRNGRITFSLNLDSELGALLAVDSSGKAEKLNELVRSKTVEFPYARTFARGPLAVSVIEHDTLGYVIGVTDTTVYLASKFLSDGAQVGSYFAKLDDEEDVLYDFQHSGRSESCLLIVRVGQTTSVQSQTQNVYVGVEGLATLFDTRTSEILYKSDIILGGAFAPTYDEARDKAFRNLADIVFSLLKVAYV